MDREQAARLLGVTADADAATVRRSFRLWVLVAHPDVGGDPQHFARLTEARRVLLVPVPAPARVPERTAFAPSPRTPLSSMLRVPARTSWLVFGALTAIAAAALPLVGVPAMVGALVAGAASAGWSAVGTRAILRAGADAGHRIATLTCTWAPVAAAQVILSLILGTHLVLALPLLVLPFVAVVAWVNAGAGLWRPIGPFEAGSSTSPLRGSST